LPAVWLWFRRYCRTFLYAWREFKQDNCVIRAAALAFVTLLSLVPTIIVFFIIINAVGAFKSFGHKLRDTLVNQVVPNTPEFEAARDWIGTVTDKLVTDVSVDIKGVSFNVISFGAMIVTAMLLLSAIEKTLNDIWAIKVRRNLLKRFGNIWTIITIGPVLIFFSYYFGLSLYTHVTADLVKQSWLYKSFIFILPYFFSIVAFYLVYQFVPYTSVKPNAALVGAVFSGIVWEFSKVPFTAYVTNVINPSGVYGTLGVIPFFLLWVYLSWVIILFGAELSYSKHNFEVISSARRYDVHFLSLYRGYYTIRVLAEAVASFGTGDGPIKVQRVAKKLGVPLNLCWELAEHLRANKLLNYVGRDRTRFQLARSPEQITITDALKGEPVTHLEVPPNLENNSDAMLREVFEKVNADRENALNSVNFAIFVHNEPDKS